MKMRITLLALTLSLLAGTAANALTIDRAAAPQPNAGVETIAATNGQAAQDLITKLGDRAMAAIKDPATDDAGKKALFRTMLTQNFDMTTIARFAAGKFWRQATPAQQQEYVKLYEQMIIDVYTARFNRYSGQTFAVTGNRLDDSGDVVVSSKVTGTGSPVMVDWRVRNKGGALKIIDVMVEGVSMAVTQRNDFAGVIQQGGGTVDSLIAYLKKGGTSDVQD